MLKELEPMRYEEESGLWYQKFKATDGCIIDVNMTKVQDKKRFPDGLDNYQIFRSLDRHPHHIANDDLLLPICPKCNDTKNVTKQEYGAIPLIPIRLYPYYECSVCAIEWNVRDGISEL